jgi:hypothetical protein
MREGKSPFAIEKTQIGEEPRRGDIRLIHRIPRPRMTRANRQYQKGFVGAIQSDVAMLLPWLFTDETSVPQNANSVVVQWIAGIIDNNTIYIEC